VLGGAARLCGCRLEVGGSGGVNKGRVEEAVEGWKAACSEQLLAAAAAVLGCVAPCGLAAGCRALGLGTSTCVLLLLGPLFGCGMRGLL
jgi:hypothetical protein